MKLFVIYAAILLTVIVPSFCRSSPALDKTLEVSSCSDVYQLFKTEIDVLQPQEYADFEAALRDIIFSLSSVEMKEVPEYNFDEVLIKAINGRSPRSIILMGACVNLGLARFEESSSTSKADKGLFRGMRQKAISSINRYSKASGVAEVPAH